MQLYAAVLSHAEHTLYDTAEAPSPNCDGWVFTVNRAGISTLVPRSGAIEEGGGGGCARTPRPTRCSLNATLYSPESKVHHPTTPSDRDRETNLNSHEELKRQTRLHRRSVMQHVRCSTPQRRRYALQQAGGPSLGYLCVLDAAVLSPLEVFECRSRTALVRVSLQGQLHGLASEPAYTLVDRGRS